MDRAKTTARRDENSFQFWDLCVLYQIFYGNCLSKNKPFNPMKKLNPISQRVNLWPHNPKFIKFTLLFIKKIWSNQIIMLHALRWRHNELDDVSNHQPHDFLLNRLFGRISKKTSKLRVTGLCAGNSPVTGEWPTQMVSNAENVSIWWHHHEIICLNGVVSSILVLALFNSSKLRHRAYSSLMKVRYGVSLVSSKSLDVDRFGDAHV